MSNCGDAPSSTLSKVFLPTSHSGTSSRPASQQHQPVEPVSGLDLDELVQYLDQQDFYAHQQHSTMLQMSDTGTKPRLKFVRMYDPFHAPPDLSEELHTPVICSTEPDFHLPQANETTIQTNSIPTSNSAEAFVALERAADEQPTQQQQQHTVVVVDATTPIPPTVVQPPTSSFAFAEPKNHQYPGLDYLDAAVFLPTDMDMFDCALLSPYSTESNHSIASTTTTTTTNTVPTEKKMCVAANIGDDYNRHAIGEPSPLGLADCGLNAEQSFNYTNAMVGSIILPIKMSQDFTDECTIFDEVQQIVNQSELYNTTQQQSTTACKQEISFVDLIFGGGLKKKIDASDELVAIPHNNYEEDDADDDACSSVRLGTVSSFSDVMLGAANFNTPVVKVFKFESQSSLEESQPLDYANLLTPAASPAESTASMQNNNSDHREGNSGIVCDVVENSIGDDDDKTESSLEECRFAVHGNETSGDRQTLLQNDHNYNLHATSVCSSSSIANNNINRTHCKRKLLVELPEQQQQTSANINYQLNTSNTSVPTQQQQQKPDGNTMRHLQQQPARVAPLRLKLPTHVSGTVLAVNTPEITNSILELEEAEAREFDLISFINSSQEYSNVMDDTDLNLDPPKPSAILNTAAASDAERYHPPTPAANTTYFSSLSPAAVTFDTPPPTKRSRLSSIDPECSNTSTATTTTAQTCAEYKSDCGNSSSSSSSGGCITPASAAAQPKRRGRPPKAHSTPISPTQLRDMSATDARYFQMRDKNNEASRRSRLNRKDREQQFADEASELEATHRRLVAQEQRLEALCRRWKERVMLAVVA